MKDHQVAKMVNDLTREIRKLCPDAPQQLRAVVSRVVRKNLESKDR